MLSRSGSGATPWTSTRPFQPMPLTGGTRGDGRARHSRHRGRPPPATRVEERAAALGRRRGPLRVEADEQDPVARRGRGPGSRAARRSAGRGPAAKTSTSESATWTPPRAPPSTPGPSPATPPALLLDRVVGGEPAGAQGRGDAEEERGRRGHAEREEQHAPVQRDVEGHGRSRAAPAVARDLADEQPARPTARRRGRGALRARPGAGSRSGAGGAGAARDAPSASRALSSWRRAFARASSRLARLAQAMSRTRTTTAITIEERALVLAAELGEPGRGRDERERASREGTAPGPAAASASGSVASRICGWTRAQGPRGRRARPGPGFSRPRISSHHVERASSQLAAVVRLDAVHHRDRHRDVERAADRGTEEGRRRHAHDREGHPVQREGAAHRVGRARRTGAARTRS